MALFVASVFASNIPAALPWPYSRGLDFLRAEKRLAARASQTSGRYLSPATGHWSKLPHVELRPLGLQQLRQLGDIDPQASGLILRSLGLLKQAYPAHYWDVVRGFLREGVVQHIGGIQTVLPQLYDDIIAQPNYAEDPSEVFWSISCE